MLLAPVSFTLKPTTAFNFSTPPLAMMVLEGDGQGGILTEHAHPLRPLQIVQCVSRGAASMRMRKAVLPQQGTVLPQFGASQLFFQRQVSFFAIKHWSLPLGAGFAK